MNRCSKCPEFKWMVLQVALIAFGIFSLICILLREDKKTKKTGRTLADVLLARLKIVIGFYQVSIEITGFSHSKILKLVSLLHYLVLRFPFFPIISASSPYLLAAFPSLFSCRLFLTSVLFSFYLLSSSQLSSSSFSSLLFPFSFPFSS